MISEDEEDLLSGLKERERERELEREVVGEGGILECHNYLNLSTLSLLSAVPAAPKPDRLFFHSMFLVLCGVPTGSTHVVGMKYMSKT